MRKFETTKANRHSADSELEPEWYKPEKYHSLRTLTSELDWFLQFAVRRECRSLISASTDGFKRPLDQSTFAFRLARQIESKPHVTIDDIEAMRGEEELICLRSIVEMYLGDAPTRTAVHTTTLEEIDSFQATLPLRMRKEHESFQEETRQAVEKYGALTTDPSIPEREKTVQSLSDFDGAAYMRKYAPVMLDRPSVFDWLGSTPYKAYFRFPLHNIQSVILGEALFTVRFDLPDELLVQQFKDALTSIRRYLSKGGVKVSDRDKSFEKQRVRWVDFRTLEIIDLLTWSLSVCAGLSNGSLWTRLQLPIKNADDSNLRRTHKTLADEMMDVFSQDFRILECRAAAVMAGKMNERESGRDMRAENAQPDRRQYRKKQR